MATRQIVGWSMADHLKADLCIGALVMALQRCQPCRGNQSVIDFYLGRGTTAITTIRAGRVFSTSETNAEDTRIAGDRVQGPQSATGPRPSEPAVPDDINRR
jgi:hypothetical protein